jgi:hypothetical protein
MPDKPRLKLMNLDDRYRAYINKAKAAEKKAAQTKDAELRESWEALARSWRMLARHVRVLEL